MVQRRVVCAAIKHGSAIICSARHYDALMRAQIKALTINPTSPLWHAEQGFIDQFGTFMTREEAWIVANDAGQVLKTVGGNDMGRLYSENLY